MNTQNARYANVIVGGAGTLGTFHAYFAAQKEYKTLLLERNPFPNDASTRNFGMIVQTIVKGGGEWAMYARNSKEIYLRLQRDYDVPVRLTGSLYVASTEVEQRVLQEFVRRHADSYSCTYFDGDSHEYSTFEEAARDEEYTHCAINATIMRYGQQMLNLPSVDLLRAARCSPR